MQIISRSHTALEFFRAKEDPINFIFIFPSPRQSMLGHFESVPILSPDYRQGIMLKTILVLSENNMNIRILANGRDDVNSKYSCIMSPIKTQTRLIANLDETR